MMDNSPEYIEMCRKATEIQEWWRNKPHTISEWAGSYFISPKDDSLIHYYDFEDYPQHSTGYTWLPQQDQLQGMVGGIDFDITFQQRNGEYVGFVQKETQEEYDILPHKRVASMEQLWLAFVMHEKYQKKWDGKEWKASE